MGLSIVGGLYHRYVTVWTAVIYYGLTSPRSTPVNVTRLEARYHMRHPKFALSYS